MSESNGSAAPATRDQVRQARYQLALTETQLRQARLDRVKKLTESSSFGDLWISALSDRIDRFSREPEAWASSPSDRQHGTNYPIFRTEQELSTLRMEARAVKICDVCGQPATLETAELRELEPVPHGSDKWVQWEATGAVHYFCDEHRPEPAGP